MAQHLRLAKTGVTHREIGDWAETEAAANIQLSLDLVMATGGGGFTLVSGPPGTGKTMAAKQFAKRYPQDCFYFQAARGEGTPWNVATSMAELWGNHARPTFYSLREARAIFAQTIGSGRILLVDEAQYLFQPHRRTGQVGDAPEWLRATAEEGGFSLAFIGDETLPDKMDAIPQLRSRMIRPVTLGKVSRADVAAILEGTSFATPEALDALRVVATRHGGLRTVLHVTRLAQMFAKGATPGPEHLRAAIADMNLTPKGA